MEYGLIGERLGHSFSAEIHKKLFDYAYELCELAPAELEAFMSAREFNAINVTIPYKEAVIPYLDQIDECAKRIGAVNTVVNKNGILCGYNTDYLGLRALILKSGKDFAGKKALVLGSGGTSKTAAAVLTDLGAEVLFVSRTSKEGAVTYDEVYKNHTDAEVIVNTTPCGMFPKNGESAISLEGFNSLCACFDAVYNPLRSAFVLEAQDKGVYAEGGLYMLVAQAVFAAELFKSEKLPKGTIDRVYKEFLTQKQNLVLIGMPGSGKTTLGQMAAEQLNLEFVDTDHIITTREGKTPAQLITKYGEEAFRDMETAAVRLAAEKNGRVIATGGGAVLRTENLSLLRENGRVIFLNRPLENLAVTKDRPLSSDREKLAKRYSERYPIYSAAADKTVECVDSKQQNVLKIKEAFLDEN